VRELDFKLLFCGAADFKDSVPTLNEQFPRHPNFNG
jgi:hypothetical protein